MRMTRAASDDRMPAPNPPVDLDRDRAVLGAALRARLDEISRTVVETWHRRSPVAAAAASASVGADILHTTTLSTLAIVAYLTEGRVQSEDEALAIAATGKAALRETIALSELTKLYFYWRDAMLATLATESAHLGIDDSVVAHTVAIVRGGSDGSIIRMAKQFDSERRRLQDALETERSRLAHQAFHDALTGLANRRLFFDRLSHALALAQRHGFGLALLYLDVDEFKTINDCFGHVAGDRVLVGIAEQLVAAVRSTDTVARLGGDEFVVVYEQLADPVGDAVALAERIAKAISAPNATGCQVSASIGIAIAGDGTRPDELIRRADHAMYAAKRHGPGHHHLAGPA